MNARIWCLGIVAGLAAGGWSMHAQAGQGSSSPGAVFTTTNEVAGNQLVVHARTPGGQLAPGVAFPTGGAGTGTGLGNQGAIAAGHGHVLYVVNAGSDTISVFGQGPAGPELLQVVGSGGQRPISIAARGHLLYVLNAGGLAGGADNVTGFTISPGGLLAPLAGSTRPLSAASTDPAQVGFAPNGKVLVVSEKMTDTLTTYVVGPGGLLGAPAPQPSAGPTPFGFDFDNKGHLIVSEAFMGLPDASAMSSYKVGKDGTLTVVSASVPTTETAACWVAITANGRLAYTTNTGSGTVSGYAVSTKSGQIVLLTPGGVTASTGPGSAPIDAATIANRLLYVLESGSGEISGFRIHPQTGALASLNAVGGLPMSSTGLLAR